MAVATEGLLVGNGRNRQASAEDLPRAATNHMTDYMIDEIVFEDQQWLHLRLTDRLCATLDSMNVFLGTAEIAKANINRTIRIPKNIEFEEYTSFGGDLLYEAGAFTYAENAVVTAKAGRYCSIAHGLQTFGERHPFERITSSSITYCFTDRYYKPQFRRAHRVLMQGRHKPEPPANAFRPVPVIQHDVWIGQHVQLARDITLGTGSVIAAGSIVTKNVAPYMIIGGNPARVIRPRFDSDVARQLLETRWWDYHPDIVWRFGYNNPVSFCDQFRRARDTGEIQPYPFRRYNWKDLLDRCSLDSHGAG
jgi:acetyltransferase-like isoleucine patch superfamily enzyme